MNSKAKNDSINKKKCLNPYMQFCLEQNAKSAQNGIKETLHTLGQKWNELSEEAKEEYLATTKANKTVIHS